MKSSLHSILTAVVLFGVVPKADSQTPTTRGGRPVDPKAIENLNRINDERAKRGQPPITAPGYTYTPADKRAPAQPIAETKAPAAEANAPAAKLRWVELVNRPEFWPAQCTMKQTMEFQGGVTIKAGQKVKVDGLTPKEVELSALDDKTQFTATPEETDVLTAANEVYAGLTPKQRELSYASLANRKELWPYRVKITQSFDLGRGQRVQAGDEAVLLNIERGKLFVMAEKFRTTYDVAPQATDLLAQARKFVEDKNGAPSRVAGELEGKLVNSVTGKPESLDAASQPRYIVLFRGSSTCSITRKFTPALVKYYDEMKPKHPEFEIVYIMTESPEDTGKFAKELGFTWRAVEYATTARMPITGKPFGDLLPQLVVMDSTGKVLANGIQNTAPAALERLDALLNQPAAP